MRHELLIGTDLLDDTELTIKKGKESIAKADRAMKEDDHSV